MSRRKNDPPAPVQGWDIWQSHYRRKIILAFVLILAAIAVALLLKPVYREFKAWRARSLASQADHLSKQAGPNDAFEKLAAAYRLNPHEPAVLRALALAYESAGAMAEASVFWDQLLKTGTANDDDRRHFIRALVATGRQADAAAQADLLLGTTRDADNLRLASEVALAGGDFTNALSYAQQAVWARPGDDGLLFYLQTFQAYSQVAGTRKAAIAAIVQRGQTDNTQIGMDAAVFLAKLTMEEGLPKSEAGWIPGRLRTHPLTSPAMQLLASKLEIQLHPERRDAILEEVVEKSAAGSDADARAGSVWLSQQKDPERALRALPLDRALKSRELLLAHLDALALLKRWDEIRKIMGKAPKAIEPPLQHIFLARCAVELGQPDAAAGEWRQAQLAAGQDPGQLLFLAQYAEKLGQTDAAANAYLALTPSAATSRQAYVALVRIYEKEKRTPSLLKTLDAMRRSWPEDAAVKNDFAYLSALLDQRTDIALTLAQELMAAEPSSMPHRTATALARLRLGRPKDAAKVYDGITVDWNTMLPRDRAVYAAVLYANGNAAEARLQALQIPKNALYPEELELIRPLIK